MGFNLESPNFFSRQMAEILPLLKNPYSINQSITKRFAKYNFGELNEVQSPYAVGLSKTQ